MLRCLVRLSPGPNTQFRQSAVLHWLLAGRLLDPDSGRETPGLTTRTRDNKGNLSLERTLINPASCEMILI